MAHSSKRDAVFAARLEWGSICRFPKEFAGLKERCGDRASPANAAGGDCSGTVLKIE